ncbi:MAG: DUF1573 domain-containing protein [Saprospiraceae bacterium]|nr:DUF1573 domain-containing protein [Saprospiraceae bacterium]
MRQFLIRLVTLFLFFISISCSTTSKLNKKTLDSRITILEEENKYLKREIEVIKSQIRELSNNFPRPHEGNTEREDIRINDSVKLNNAIMKFDNTSHDFGTIKAGNSVSYTYKFKNTGNIPLQITNAKGSCGCTVPKWPKAKIEPGDEGEILVTFNSKGKKGHQHKSITITANTNPTATRLYIKATIEE